MAAKVKRSEALLALAAAIEKLAAAIDRRTAIEAAKPVSSETSSLISSR